MMTQSCQFKWMASLMYQNHIPFWIEWTLDTSLDGLRTEFHFLQLMPRCWKGLWLQLMCYAPFILLSQDFRMRRWSTGDWRIGVEGWSCSQSRTLKDKNQEEDLFNIQTEVST